MPTTYPASFGEWSESSKDLSKGDEKLVKRIQERFKYMSAAWRRIREEAEDDMRSLSIVGPWPEGDIESRKQKGRPCIHLDQLTQYVDETINEVRMNPIAIKVDPNGEGTSEDTAELRSKRIRAIEYESNAQSAYLTAFEYATSMSFGAFGITVEHKAWDSFDKVIRLRRFANPWDILWDPDCKEQDCSDMRDCFVIDRMLKSEYEEQHEGFSLSSFGEEEVRQASDWLTGDKIQIAEYWYRETKPRRMFLLGMPDGGKLKIFADEIEGFKIKGEHVIFRDGSAAKILQDRRTEQPFIKMCLTNGLEILEKNDWPGKWIPIVPVLAKEVFYREGNEVKKRYESRIRKARQGQLLFDYYVSNEAETISMVPKIPYVGYTGQFTAPYWETLNQEPRAYAEVEPHVDGSPDVLPLPQRQAFEPPIQALEVGKESTRRSIQAAIGSYGFTRLDDTNVKSGVALERLKAQNNLGSYHLVDNFKMAIRHAGRIINDLLDDVETEPMTVALRGMDDKQETANINQPGPDGKMVAYRLTDEGQHEVTITEGPSYQSQREEAREFTKNLVGQIKNLPVEPAVAQKLLALLVRLEQLGPIGDKIEQLLDPDEAGDDALPRALQALQKTQQQLQALNAYAKQLEQKLIEAQDKIESKEAENATRVQIVTMQEETKRLTKLAELQSKEAIAQLKASIDAIQGKQEMAMEERRQEHEERMGMMDADMKEREMSGKMQMEREKAKAKPRKGKKSE